jgi:hypothetical protein
MARSALMPDNENETAHRNGNSGIRAGEAIKHAREILADVLGKDAESVSGVNRSEEGWAVALDVVELSRIPPSTDLLATYDVTLDSSGDLVDLARSRRYMRNQADED